MKKNTWKKLMSLALGAMMMLSLLTGCGSKTEAIRTTQIYAEITNQKVSRDLAVLSETTKQI